jgi:threonine synthase
MTFVNLGEGNTPLIQSVRIGRLLDRVDRLFFKLENTNPSGSYKDRFTAAEVERVLGSPTKGCLATSSGNTGSSLAAYCARHNLACLIVVNWDTPAGKLAQMQAHGAQVLRIRDFTTSPLLAQRTFDVLAEIATEVGMSLVVSAYRYCPVGMSGVEPIALEITRQCDSAIDHVFVPVGGGGLYTAICRGFNKETATAPRIHVVQPEGCPTVVTAFERGEARIRPVESTTRISGLSVPFDVDASLALYHLRQSGGHAFAVCDEEVFEAQQMLLGQEGICTEPAGATALAGFCKALREGIVRRSETVVCLVTGHGFKDPESLSLAASRHPAVTVEIPELRHTISELAKCV